MTIDDRAMSHIQTLDPNATLNFSRSTGQWYVSARVEIGGDGMLTSICEHRTSPRQALLATLGQLQNVVDPLYLVVGGYSNERRHYRWNGWQFEELARVAS